ARGFRHRCTEASMDREHNTAGPAETEDHDIQASLATIQEQTGQTLELLRTLIGLILPELGDREGRPLDELIATLIVRQREILKMPQRIQTDGRALADHLAGREDPDRNSHAAPNGAAGSC